MKKIMLDPGHAGAYYNASPVVNGYYESAMTWSLAGKLRDALVRRGFEVGLTRQNMWEDPELTERGRRAEGYDLLLSLHSNAAVGEAPDAPWMICYSSDDSTLLDECSCRIGEVLGSVVSRVMGVSAPYIYKKRCDFDRDGDGILNDEWYGVLFGAKSVGVPAVIAEHSFHTNRRAAEWLLDEDNLTRLAEAEADALAEYFVTDGEIKMTEAEKKQMDALKKRVDVLEGRMSDVQIKYNWTTACPKWARGTVHRLHQRGILEGDEAGQLRLTEPMLRILVMLERAGVI